MFVFPHHAILIGIASVMLDLGVLIYQIMEFRRKNSHK